MKKLELKFGSIKEMLTKEQMKQIHGGNVICYGLNSDGSTGAGVFDFTDVNDPCAAQKECDEYVLTSTGNTFPGGCDCPSSGPC